MKVSRKYYRLDEAAKLLGVTTDDLIHLAAHSEINLHVLLPSGVRVSPIWHDEKDVFAEKNLFPVSAWPADRPVDIEERNWKAYEADQAGAKFRHLSNKNLTDWELTDTPPGVDFGGWELRDEKWNPTEVRVADCSIVLILSEFQRLSLAEKTLASNERQTLLTIIAALCDYSAIKYQERGAATHIAKLTEELGAPVSHSSVSRVLEKIPDALEARMK